MKTVPVDVGDSTTFAKTVTEADVILFAGLSGDFAPHHVNEEFMRGTMFGTRIAHGALSLGFMSAVSAKLMAAIPVSKSHDVLIPLSLGYDRLRFLKPVFFGDTLTSTYRVLEVDLDRKNPRTLASVEIHNQRGELTASAIHINAWVPVTSQG